MSHYATSLLMWNVARDKDLAERFQAAPDSVLADYDLTDAEREVLREQDIRELFVMGTHPFVLYHFALRLEGAVSMPFMRSYVAKLQGLNVGNLET